MLLLTSTCKSVSACTLQVPVIYWRLYKILRENMLLTNALQASINFIIHVVKGLLKSYAVVQNKAPQLQGRCGTCILIFYKNTSFKFCCR